MHCLRVLVTLFIITLSFYPQTGCKQKGDTTSPSTSQPSENKKKKLMEITVGGKVWKIDPNQSYQATGVWANPNPRSLTAAERERIQKIPALIQTLKTQIDELDKELRYLERVDETQIKVRYNFGKSPHLLPKDKREIIDLGVFPMEMEKPTNIPTEK